MKKIFLTAFFIFFANHTWAAVGNVAQNKSVDQCVKKYGENDDECLGAISDKSESDLKLVYEAKLKEISDFDYTRWWMGTQEQKDQLLATYKKNQQDWIQFKNDYCELVSTQAKGTHAFTENMLSCVINMNELRSEQIRMIVL
jgi:uncharacterized protein YecT (DUF1311 family)